MTKLQVFCRNHTGNLIQFMNLVVVRIFETKTVAVEIPHQNPICAETESTLMSYDSTRSTDMTPNLSHGLLSTETLHVCSTERDPLVRTRDLSDQSLHGLDGKTELDAKVLDECGSPTRIRRGYVHQRVEAALAEEGGVDGLQAVRGRHHEHTAGQLVSREHRRALGDPIDLSE